MIRDLLARHDMILPTARQVAVAALALTGLALALASSCDTDAARAERQAREAREWEAQVCRNTIQYVESTQSPAHGADALTDAQRRAAWGAMEGQWVWWTGEIRSVTGGDGGAPCRVTLRVAPTTLTADTSFDLPRSVALGLSRGQVVTVEGRLDRHDFIGYELRDARLVRH